MHAWPQGAGDGNTHSMGIVLNHAGDDGELRNGDDGEGESCAAGRDSAGPELLPTPVAESPTSTVTENHSSKLSSRAAASGVVPVSATQEVSGRSAMGEVAVAHRAAPAKPR